MSQQEQRKGIGAYFKDDALALLAIYQSHGITHDELRANLEKLGAFIGRWPDERPKPLLYKLWQGIADEDGNPIDLDDEETEVHLVPPPPIPLRSVETEES